MTTGQAIAAIAVMAVMTFLTRALPFLLFDRGDHPPKIVLYLGRVLPPAIIAMLIVYCYCSSYRNTTFAAGGWGIPEAVASLAVVLLQMWKRNPLLSIMVGTAIYMVFKQQIW